MISVCRSGQNTYFRTNPFHEICDSALVVEAPRQLPSLPSPKSGPDYNVVYFRVSITVCHCHIWAIGDIGFLLIAIFSKRVQFNHFSG